VTEWGWTVLPMPATFTSGGLVTAPMPGPRGAYPPSPGGAVSSDDRTMALLAHLSPLIAMVISVGWLSIAGPLVLWLLNKNRSPFVRQAAAGAFNFNLSMWALSIIGWICIFSIVLLPVGLILLPLSFILQIAFHIVGAVRANRGEFYRYPMQFIRVLS